MCVNASLGIIKLEKSLRSVKYVTAPAKLASDRPKASA